MLVSVHSHAREEHLRTARVASSLSGSFPCSRVTHLAAQHFTGQRRFITTHAENTFITHSLIIYLTVHPTHMGNTSQDLVVCERHRFIPTHVGNTSMSHSKHIKRPVHPHGCGEHMIPIDFQPGDYGSSPRMWGTLMPSTKKRNKRSVHPHACGEHPPRTDECSP